MKRKQFTFYRSFFSAMSEMNMLERGMAVTWLCQYALDGIQPPPMKGKQKIYCDLVLPNLEAGRRKAIAGQLGGSTTKASKQRSKKENEIEKEKELEIELETETETNCGEGEVPQGRGSVWLGFERFWDKYPVKIGMEEAWEQWQHLCPDADRLCKSLEAWMRTPQWIKEKGRYIPRAAKFLEQEYYLQAPEAETGATGRLGQAELEAIERIMKEDL